MTTLIFRTSDGAEQTVRTKAGFTVMEAGVAAGVEGIDADCGGGCACGTCHVHIDPARFDSFPAADIAEREMLEMVQNRSGCSRLSCQIIVTESHDGLIITVPSPNGPE